MINFIPASQTNKPTVPESTDRTDKFINMFNSCITSTTHPQPDGPFYLNDGLDKIPFLDSNEFLYLRGLAKEQGWSLTRYNDNYQTITYKMKRI